MLRLIGACILLLSGVLIGLQFRRTAKQRIGRLASVIFLVRYAQRKISLFSTPAADLFSDFPEHSREVEPEIVRIIMTFPTGEAMEQIACVLEEEGGILRNFWREVGVGYKEDALASCNYCLELLEERLMHAKEVFAQRNKLYVSLPILLVISIIVLLL